jgi:hypothetical protein
MAGRPRTRLKKLAELSAAADGIFQGLRAAMPTGYLDTLMADLRSSINQCDAMCGTNNAHTVKPCLALVVG